MPISTPLQNDFLTDVKARLLDAGTKLVLFVVVPGHLLVVYLRLQQGELAAGDIAHAIIVLGGALVVGSLSRAPSHLRAGVILVYALASATMGVHLYGPQLVDGLTFTISLVFGIVYFGWRGLALTIIGTSVAMSLVAQGQTAGWFQVPDLALFDLTDPKNLIRFTSGAILGSLIVGTIVVYLTKAIDGSLDRLGEAVDREARQRGARRRAQRALEHSQRLETIGQLAGGVAHDFNNALVVILGTAQLLGRSKGAEPRQRRLAAAIEEAGWQASDVSRQLLTFSRDDVTKPEDLDLDEAVLHMVRVIERLLPEDIEVEAEVASGARVHIDPSLLDQVFFHLAIHAQETMRGGGKLWIRTSMEAERARIDVSDNGPGLAPDAVALLFDPFLSEGGDEVDTGFGLPLVHQIIVDAGGWIDCRSTPGEGTSFEITLPQVVETEAPTLPPETEEARVKRSVLLLEGSEEVRAVMRRVLASAEFDVAAAGSVEEAARLIEQTPHFDLLCTDSKIPGGSVLETIERFEFANPNASLLFCSGPLRVGEFRAYLERAHSAHLLKPFAPDELLAAAQKLMLPLPSEATDG